MALEIATRLLLLAWIVLWCVGVFMNFAYRNRLRTLYPDIAERVAPGFYRRSITSEFARLRFIFRREYVSLDRKDFVRLCDSYRIVLIAFLVGFLGFIVCTLLGGMGS